VADGAVVASGYVERVLERLDALPTVLHVLPPGEPTADSVDAAAAAMRDLERSFVVGVGGGSAMDTAKQAAAVACGPHGIEHYALGVAPWTGHHQVVVIPTTAGTGSEVTRTCIFTDRAGRKLWTWGEDLLPHLVLLDPAATATMPSAVTTACGLDAFVHAVEATTGRRSSTLVAAPALHAARLIVDHLPAAVADGDDLDARQAMQEAALLAGMAIDGGGTGIAHSIGHALGTLSGVPHGVAVAVGLAASMEWSVAGAGESYTQLADTLHCTVTELPARYLSLAEAVRLADAAARVEPVEASAEAVAATMVAAENQPMWANNSRRADDDERLALASATLQWWDRSVRPIRPDPAGSDVQNGETSSS